MTGAGGVIAAVLFFSSLPIIRAAADTVVGLEAGTERPLLILPPKLNVPPWASGQPYMANAADGYTSTVRSAPEFKVVRNAWWHDQRFYAFLQPGDMSNSSYEEGLSPNLGITAAPIKDMALHRENLRSAFVPGNTLLVDIPFQAYPDHLGHWAEIWVPIFSLLRSGTWRRDVAVSGTQTISSLYISRILATNWNKQVSPFLKAVLQAAATPGLRTGTLEPQIVDYADLVTFDNIAWLAFENLIVAQDRYTERDNRRGFTSGEHGDMWAHDDCQRYVSPDVVVRFSKPEDGVAFRRAMYESARISPGVDGSPPFRPTTITLLMQAGDDWPGVVNHKELYEGLQEVADEHGLKARILTATNDASLGTLLDAASRSAVLVGRHSSLMAAAVLMRPGTMVFELMPYKWEWSKISMLYYNITQSVGDIHHFAWRPTHWKHAVFSNTSDYKYLTWTPTECHAKECLSVWARQGLLVDVPTVLAKLRAKLPRVLAGDSVEALREPWPEAV